MRNGLLRTDDFFNGLWNWDRFEAPQLKTTAPAGIEETENEYVFQLDVPGVKKENIHVEVVDKTIKITGERTQAVSENRKGTHLEERSFGKFERAFTVRDAVDFEGINAHFEDGVLKLTLPKKEAAKPRRIEVK
jgi:HSP20 family protein